MATPIDYMQRLTEQFNFDNQPLLIAAGVSYIVGYLQYVYAIRLMLRDGDGVLPFWMHSFYLAHDSTWSYLCAQFAKEYNNHWFLRATSTGLMLWSAMEIFCIHRAITRDRTKVFPSVLGPNASTGRIVAYAAVLQVVMYAVVRVGIVLMGEGCLMQWFCLTNVLIVLGPTHEYLRRGSRKGLSLGFCTVNIVGTIFTFAPFSMWGQTIPELFQQEGYYAVGVVLTAYAVWLFYVVAQYPPKVQGKGEPTPIW
ncbi:hypothetical protein SEUCBS139899_007614 [Sporothrix eucalyptigena]|uniref:Uncharacterized protein n=1 Tax=Sporothrix eucalyptigena TaxID=1812306 RepID=A0ABP0C1C2_9PEZI